MLWFVGGVRTVYLFECLGSKGNIKTLLRMIIDFVLPSTNITTKKNARKKNKQIVIDTKFNNISNERIDAMQWSIAEILDI